MILIKIKGPEYFSSMWDIVERRLMFYEYPCLKILKKSNYYKKYCLVGFQPQTRIFYIFWKIPSKLETLFWLSFKGEQGISYVEDEAQMDQICQTNGLKTYEIQASRLIQQS